MTYDLVLTAHDVRVLGAMLATASGLYYGDPKGRALTAEALGVLRQFSQDDVQQALTKFMDVALRRVEDLAVPPQPAPGSAAP